MIALPATSTLVGEVVLIALIAIVLYIVFKIGKSLFKLLFGIIANSILGLIAIFVLNYFLNADIPIHLYTLIPVALFGLPAVGTFLILKFFGALPTMVILI